jgi:hypothetical protein
MIINDVATSTETTTTIAAFTVLSARSGRSSARSVSTTLATFLRHGPAALTAQDGRGGVHRRARHTALHHHASRRTGASCSRVPHAVVHTVESSPSRRGPQR